jgi:FkbM family methyltransferase
VLAFEPVSTNFDRLRASINLNHFGHVIQALRVAVTDRAGSVKIVSHVNTLNSGSSHIWAEEPGPAHEAIEEVCSVTIDETLPADHIDFMKVDVEGAEYLAMRGAERLLKRCKPKIMMELNQEQLRRISAVEISTLVDYITCFGYSVNELSRDGSTKLVANFTEALPRLLRESGFFNVALLPT